ncbi:MAG: tRNA (adenosine(37)-N6)-threonylcarbamoyltransferase complex ATPase subunit type 1 TsaE [Peptococcaceae bacterium]|jgi:tRNA threonylcarbamoyladenosine biosynthesis protein TsaE|nr:tRNA (adenosine(37)-N6)-threonylcarbamoyltransferase complex ATPase subunit type 1 TsaE [Peptococcaceae bacterium]
MKQTYRTTSAAETYNLGQKIAQKLKGGELLCLYGPLGAGKTVLAKGLGQGLGISEEITSPTFNLIQEYDLDEGLKFVHMDLYRLQHPEEAEIIGVPDYFREDCICLIEWPEIIEDYLPEDKLIIRIEGSGELPRTIEIENWVN